MTILRFLFENRSPTFARRVLAAIAAPPLAMALYGLMAPFWFGSGSSVQIVGMTLIMVAIGSLFAYVGMLIVGLPANVGLRSLKAERGIVYILIGAVSLPILLAIKDPSAPTFAQMTLAATPGALVAGLWWHIASRPPSPRQTHVG